MKNTIIPLFPEQYRAKPFKTNTVFGVFQTAGTLCGNIDFVIPNAGTYTLSQEEAFTIISILCSSLEDVSKNSKPNSDPRIYK